MQMWILNMLKYEPYIVMTGFLIIIAIMIFV